MRAGLSFSCENNIFSKRVIQVFFCRYRSFFEPINSLLFLWAENHCSQDGRLMSFYRKLSTSHPAHVKPSVPSQPEHEHSSSDSFHTVTPLSESESVPSSSPHGGTSTETQQHENRRNTKAPYSCRGIKFSIMSCRKSRTGQADRQRKLRFIK